MKNKLPVITFAILSLLMSAALADDSTRNNEVSMTAMTNGMAGAHSAKASDIMGLNVKNPQDQTLGRVKDFAVDVQAGRILYVIVSAGGIMGVGGTLHAVPPGVLHFEDTNKAVRLEPEPAQLDSPFDASKWADECGSNRVMEIYGQYHQTPYFATPDYTNLLTPRQVSVMNDSGSPTLQPPTPRWGPIVRASKVIGTPIVNLQGEKLGKVEDLMVTLPGGRVLYVIVSTGGFMGMEGELSAVPARAFRYDAETNRLQLDASKARLTNAPHFTSGHWPDVDQPAYANSIYSAYAMYPYFNTDEFNTNDTSMTGMRTNAVHDVDNTARNERDRNGGTLTPFDQGTSTSDLNTTAQIRKQIMARAGFSTYAQNIKIITRDGKVTLRGPVNTTDEKSQIGEIADSVAGGDNVDNQLQVKMTTNN